MLTRYQYCACVHPVLAYEYLLASVCKRVHLNLYRGPSNLTCLLATSAKNVNAHIINFGRTPRKNCFKESSAACWSYAQSQNLPHRHVKQGGTRAWMPFGPATALPERVHSLVKLLKNCFKSDASSPVLVRAVTRSTTSGYAACWGQCMDALWS